MGNSWQLPSSMHNPIKKPIQNNITYNNRGQEPPRGDARSYKDNQCTYNVNATHIIARLGCRKTP
jgi:hypothetical protein